MYKCMIPLLLVIPFLSTAGEEAASVQTSERPFVLRLLMFSLLPGIATVLIGLAIGRALPLLQRAVSEDEAGYES